jgi:uncharacterized membrane protein SpoIIM required for sporulation
VNQAVLGRWLERRRERWQRLAQLTRETGDRRGNADRESAELVRGFRGLASDLALARVVVPGSALVRELEALFMRAHRLIYRAPTNLKRDLAQLYGVELPALVRQMAGRLAAVFGLFLVTAFAGFWLVYRHPELASLFASEAMIEHVEKGELWTDGLLNIMPSSILAFSIITNNITVTLFAFTLGALYGLGTVYIIGLNGLMLGGVFALTAQHAMAERLFRFIVAHGLVEMSVIFIAGAAGITIGEALARPGQQTRAEGFRKAVEQAGKLLMACLPFLAGAGLIEGYVSPNDRFDLIQRVIIGVAYEALFVLVLLGKIQWPVGTRRNA